MSDNQVNNVLSATMEKVREMVDVNTIVGDPITSPDGTILIPVSRITYGVISGGSDLPSKNTPPAGLFGGGAGVGVTVFPVAFISINNGNVKMMQIEPYYNSIDRVIDKMPDAIDKITSLFKKNPKEEGQTGSDIEIIE